MAVCKCGCGRTTTIIKWGNKTRGEVKGAPRDYIHGHWRVGRVTDDEERIARYSEPQPNGCVLWTGARDKDGYGIYNPFKSKSVRITRFIYEKRIGLIPEGLFVCHKCDNPSCINTDHFFLGTNDDNMHDMVEKGRSLKGDRHPKRRARMSV